MKITLIYKSYEEEVVNDNNERTMYHIIHDILPEKIDAFLKKHEIKECKIRIEGTTRLVHIQHGLGALFG